MAAINCEQQEFALHSLNDEYKNKTFVFVKLTDSALKSIEDYMSLNPNTRQGIAKPTIQFQSNSNQGAITLPLSPSHNNANGKQEIKYSFGLSNVDADGPQGSFEFLRQRKVNKYEECIESLGSMFIKMQFHASEDIYQKTKVKMANAELDAKKHSTKVIKETGPNVGRKIKKTILNSDQSSAYHHSNGYKDSYKDTLRDNYKDNFLSVNSTFETNQHSPKSSSLSKFLLNTNAALKNATTTTNSSANHNNSKQIDDSSSCLNSINHMTSSTKDSQQQQNSSTHSQQANQSKSSNSATSTAIAIASSTSNSQTAPNPDIIRKPVRDRIVHLLAIRPFKKPELLAKLNRDGLREKDKKGISALLSQISNLKENAYHLHRGGWHEVQVDDWPFYTNEERELVRKRNPLSTSSHLNANSTDLNSAINSISPLANLDNQQSPIAMLNSPSNKRTIDQSSSANGQAAAQVSGTLSVGDYDYATANKKQRISHHKANSEASKKRSPPLSNSINTAIQANNSSFNGRHGKHQSSTSNKLTTKYDDVINIWENKPKTPDDQQLQSATSNGHCTSSNLNNHSSPELNSSVNSNSSNGLVSNKLVSGIVERAAKTSKNGLNSSYRNGSANNLATTTTADRYHHTNNISSYTNSTSYHSNQFHHHSSNNATTNSHFNSFTNHHHHYNNSNQPQHNSSLCSTPNSSPDSGTGSNDGSLASTSSSRSTNSSNEDYLSKYTEITSIEQFRKYKQDFNCEYEEYKKLHNIVDRNANKFALLEQELRQAQEGSETWNRIMERILREYDDIKRDSTYLNARSRMQYLHMKLSHIKSLILNYTNQTQYHRTKHGSNSSSIKFNSLNTGNSRMRSRNHSSVPVQQSNRSKMITSS